VDIRPQEHHRLLHVGAGHLELPQGQGDGDTGLAQINIATGTTTPIAPGPGVKLYPSVLSSGEIAYVRHSTTLPQGVFYADGKPGPAGADIHAPSWSPNGAQVAYSRYKTTRVPEPQKLWSRNPNFEISTTTFLPAYAPGGDGFAATKVNKDMTSSLVIIDEGKPARSILDRKELMLAPQWSPDGKQIVFGIGGFTAFADFAVGGRKPVDPVNGGAQVAIVNADGTGFHLVTSGPNNNAFASFAPDGKHLVYRTAGPDGEGLRIMNLEDQTFNTLTDEYDNFPVWSPRNDLIAFIRKVDGNFEVFTIHPDGKDIKQLTNSPGNEAHLAWSPDGERLAFTSERMGFKDEALYTDNPQPYGEIFVMRFDGTQIEQLTDDQWEEGGPAWAAPLSHSK
jgi:TolB protein